MITLFLAYLSSKYVEAPFRQRGIVRKRLIFSFGFVFTFFIAVGYFGQIKNGFESRFERVLSGDIGHIEFYRYIDEKYFDCEPKAIAEKALSWEGVLRCKQSRQGTPEIVLLGDSHAEHLFPGLAEYIPSKVVVFYFLDAKPYVEANDFKHIFNELLSNSVPQHIILTMHFIGRVDYLGTGLYEGFSSTIKTLLKAGKTVSLVGNVPRFNQDPGLCVYSFSTQSRSSCFLSRVDVERQSLIYEGILKRLSNEYRVTYLSVDDVLCVDNFCGMAKGDTILYRDNNHLNIVGSKLIGKFLSERLSLQ